jgi:ABC-type spermidine/putrescine transport system permease subunit II
MFLMVSLIGLVTCMIVRLIRQRESSRIVPNIVVIGFGVTVFFLAWRAKFDEAKGLSETIGVVFCYFAMLLGMCAEYGYRQGERVRRRRKFDLMQFLMPFFASPIVFIPLLTITTDLTNQGALSKSRLMIYLVAFQNGFFWKSFFDDRRQHALESVPPAPMGSRPKSEARTMTARAGGLG